MSKSVILDIKADLTLLGLPNFPWIFLIQNPGHFQLIPMCQYSRENSPWVSGHVDDISIMWLANYKFPRMNEKGHLHEEDSKHD